MSSMTGDYTSMAEAVGEAPLRPMAFIPGVDFDPYDEDDVALTREVSYWDGMHVRDRTIADLQAENAHLRSLTDTEED